MRKIVITFGLISGGILAAMTAITLPLCMNGTIDFSNAELVGYSVMVLSFLAVFFGIRTYRDNVAGGVITFGRAFKVGILITLISCAVYVIGWEIVYWNFIPDFDETYSEFVIDKLRRDGGTPAEIEAKTKQMARFRELYANPLINIGITFLEVFPVGLIVTLVSAAILRKKPTGMSPEAAAATA